MTGPRRWFSDRREKDSRWVSARASQKIVACRISSGSGSLPGTVVQAPSVGGYAVPGGLSCPGLAQGRCAQELLPGDGGHVHHRHLILPSQELPEDFIRSYYCGLIGAHGHEVNVGVLTVVACGPGTKEYHLCRAEPFLHLPGLLPGPGGRAAIARPRGSGALLGGRVWAVTDVMLLGRTLPLHILPHPRLRLWRSAP